MVNWTLANSQEEKYEQRVKENKDEEEEEEVANNRLAEQQQSNKMYRLRYKRPRRLFTHTHTQKRRGEAVRCSRPLTICHPLCLHGHTRKLHLKS